MNQDTKVQNLENPKGLPVIEENSLHKIVTTVKLYQEFEELKKENNEEYAILIFEEKYNNADKQSVEHICFKKYFSANRGLIAMLDEDEPIYSNWQIEFSLIKEVKTEKSLDIGEYLEFKYDENSINSKKPFYWKEWDFAEDDRGEVISKKYQENKNHYDDIIYPDDIRNLINKVNKKDFYNIVFSPKVYEYTNSPVDIKHIVYNYSIVFNKLTIGKVTNPFRDNEDKKKSRGVISFYKNVSIKDCEFTKNTSFSNCKFWGGLSLKYSTFYSKCLFNNTFFNVKSEKGKISKIGYNTFCDKSVFNGSFIFNPNDNIFFHRNTFKDSCETLKICVFGGLIIRSSNFENSFKIDRLLTLENNRKIKVCFDKSTFSQKLYFSLADDSKENYQNLTLNLYHSSFADFVCDDRNLSEVNLFYSDRSGEITNGNKDDKNHIERAIAERRVFRKILQDLNWGDKADEEYAKIMDLQLGLKKPVPRFFEWLFFCKWLGWGVRILHRNPLKGGIIWSTLLLFFIYFLLYKIPDWQYIKIEQYFFGNENFFVLYRNIFSVSSVAINEAIEKNTNIFKIISLVFNDAADVRDSFIAITGFLQANFFLVIIARKFMRM